MPPQTCQLSLIQSDIIKQLFHLKSSLSFRVRKVPHLFNQGVSSNSLIQPALYWFELTKFVVIIEQNFEKI